MKNRTLAYCFILALFLPSLVLAQVVLPYVQNFDSCSSYTQTWDSGTESWTAPDCNGLGTPEYTALAGGVISAYTSNSITDTTVNFSALGVAAGDYLYSYSGSPSQIQISSISITTNPNDTLNLASSFTTDPTVGQTYVIYQTKTNGYLMFPGLEGLVSISSGSAMGGSGLGLRRWVGGGGDNGTGGVLYLGPFENPSDQVIYPTNLWVRYYIRFQPGYQFTVQNFMKMIYFNAPSSSGWASPLVELSAWDKSQFGQFGYPDANGDSNGEFMDNEIYWSPSTPFSVGTVVTFTDQTVWKCTTAGTTGSSPPNDSGKTVGQTLPDGTVVWTELNANAQNYDSFPIFGWNQVNPSGAVNTSAQSCPSNCGPGLNQQCTCVNGDGSWHCIEAHLQYDTAGSSSSPSAYNGVADFWIDGVNIIHLTGLNITEGVTRGSSVGVGQVEIRTNQSTIPGGQFYYEDIDNIEIASDTYPPAGGWQTDAQGRQMIGTLSGSNNPGGPVRRFGVGMIRPW